MMNPSAYWQEEERYEAAETAQTLRARKRRPAGKDHCLCSREVLPSGCIIYRMAAQRESQRAQSPGRFNPPQGSN
jgi:hypothetical protein